jgi:hypothetical protein
MINIAFHRAKNTRFKGYFHDDFIVEYYSDSDNTFAEMGGWEVLSEEDFNKEMLKNPELHVIFLEKQKQMADSCEKSAKQAEIVRLQLTKEERLELEKLRKFKKSVKRTHA